MEYFAGEGITEDGMKRKLEAGPSILMSVHFASVDCIYNPIQGTMAMQETVSVLMK